MQLLGVNKYPVFAYMHARRNRIMNIIQNENEAVIISAKMCGCQSTGGKVTYSILDQTHAICHDKKDIIQAEIKACERLLKYADESERRLVEKELGDLKMALDLMS